MKKPAILLIRSYQAIRPSLETLLVSVFGFHFSCKHSPTCSQYTLLQIEEHGTISGLFLGMKRILGCWGRLS